MIALVRYQLAIVALSQRYLAPVLLHVLVLVLATRNDNSDVLPVFALWSGSLLITAIWLTMMVLGAESTAQQDLTEIAARGPLRPLVARILAVGTILLPLIALGSVEPLIVGLIPVTGWDYPIGVAGQLVAAITGVGVGVLCGPPLINRLGVGFLLAALAAVALLLVRPLPVLNGLLRDLSTQHADRIIGHLAVDLALAVFLLIATSAFRLWRNTAR